MAILKRAVKLVVSIIVFCFDSVTRICKTTIGSKRSTRCVILYYHSVRPEERMRFGRQLDEILRFATPIWADRPDMIVEGCHHVAITFDDGYRSFRDNALPELVQRKIPVHLFVPSGCIGQEPIWLDVDDPEREREMIMTAEELKALDPRRVAIGSHCVSHRDLTSLNDDEAEIEIIESKKTLESMLGRKVETVSIPHGFYDARHIVCARRTGYQRVFSVYPHLAFRTEDEYLTGRVRVDPGDHVLEFKLKTLGCYRWMAVVSQFLRSCRRGT
jgi:peptidoglycan/xylan/chitin deacetylase (PgdA/CDA1 family)